jgi:hypothetical protein
MGWEMPEIIASPRGNAAGLIGQSIKQRHEAAGHTVNSKQQRII